ncbi:uncharacterized protein LOC103509596 [Diaphorina citri]|uniref:Uncharacterized protein LOC103509596 n=1 Tax=Diaphorina citri TaxID=121845 RepID=A0A3Q0ITT6_DIACI|nr:uncharacterized protein LOC103509596 [Diaphorina citri]
MLVSIFLADEESSTTPEVQDTGKQNGSVASSANIGEHKVTDSEGEKTKLEKKDEDSSATPEVQDTGKQNGSVASSANIGEHKVTDSDGEKTKLEKKEEDSSGKISNVFTSITNGISSSVAEVIQSVEDISTKIIEDVEHVTGLELDISKTKESNDLPTEKTDRDTNGGMSTSKDNFNTKTDQKTEVENKAVDKSSTNESQSTSDNSIEGTVTSKEESNIADEVKEKLEEVKKSEELVEAKNTAVVEEPIYGNLKPDHAEYVTVTPDSTDSPKKTDVSGTEDNKTADKDHTKDDLEATKETSKEEGKIAEEKSETCIKQETNELLAEKSTVSLKDEIESVTTADTTSGTNDEVPTALSAPTNDTDEKSQGKDQKITENKTSGSPKEKTDGQENLQEGKVIESTAEDINDKKESKESAVSKSPVGSSIPSPTKGDSKEVIDENDITKSSTADTDGVQEKRDSIADQKNDTVTLSEESKPLDGEKSISADKADTTIEDKDGVEQKSTDKKDSVVAPGDEKSNDKTENIKEEDDADKTKKEPLDPKSSKPEISESEEKVDLDPTRYGSEGKPEPEAKDTAKELHEDNKVDAKQDGKPDEDNKGDAKQDKKTESSTKLAEDKIEDHGTPPKSPSDILDSRKTSTESLGKSTTESILSADQPEELDKEVTVSQDRKLSKDELIIAEVSKSEVKSDVESTLPKENLEKISTDNGPSETKITSSVTTTKTSEPVDSSKASPVKATEDKVSSDIESKKESDV